jgi:hypothetical protein
MTGIRRLNRSWWQSSSSSIVSISLHSSAKVSKLVRNSEMGCPDPNKMGEQSPSTTRKIYGYSSSYDTMDTLARNVAWSVVLSRPHLARYSASALRAMISDNMHSYMTSTFEVISSMNRSFLASASFTRATGARSQSTTLVVEASIITIIGDDSTIGKRIFQAPESINSRISIGRSKS